MGRHEKEKKKKKINVKSNEEQKREAKTGGRIMGGVRERGGGKYDAVVCRSKKRLRDVWCSVE
jgi:hypothetical protein